ncbi:MAG: AI-2E family transporter [Clostridia bacterium]|nr:AI-2E family transporter [Clostridia bacterium]
MFKKYKNHKYASIAFYAFLVILLSVALIFTLVYIKEIWEYIGNLLGAVTAFIYGFAIAYLCNPIYKRMHTYVFAFIEKKKARPKLRKTFSLICTYIVFFGVIAIIVFALIPSIGGSVDKFAKGFSGYIADLQTSLESLLNTLSINIPIFNSDDVVKLFTDIFYKDGKLIIWDYLIPAGEAIIFTATSIVRHVVYFIIGLILSVYFLMYKQSMTAKVRKLFCAIFSKKTYQRICDFAVYTDKTFGRYLMGAALDSLLVGTIVVVVLSILGYEFAALIGVIVGITNIIPFFGPFLGAVPSAFIILIADGFVEMIIFIAIILVLQQIDGNIINPHIVGATTGLTPIGVIAAVTVCSHIFGFLGMVIGVPLCAVLTYMVSMILDKRLKTKNLPSDTKLFKNKDIYSNEAFIAASLEVEAMNILEKQQKEEELKQEEQEHNKAISIKHDELMYVLTHPDEFAKDVPVAEAQTDAPTDTNTETPAPDEVKSTSKTTSKSKTKSTSKSRSKTKSKSRSRTKAKPKNYTPLADVPDIDEGEDDDDYLDD